MFSGITDMGAEDNGVVCCREILCFFTWGEDLLVTHNQENLERGRVQGWMSEQAEQALSLS